MGKVIRMREPERRPSRNRIRQESRVVEVEQRVEYTKSIDYVSLVLVALLVAFGLIMVYSSSYYVSQIRGESQAYYFIKQIISAFIGAVLMIILSNFDYHNFIAFSYDRNKLANGYYRRRPVLQKPYIWALIGAAVSLFLVYTPIGMSVNGSRRWINLGISIQPSEIVKIGMIIFISGSLAEFPTRIMRFWDGLVYPYLTVLLLLCAVIFFQPNFSAIVCISIIVMCMLWVGGMRASHFMIIIVVGLIGGVFFLLMKDYRVQRIEDLVNPYNSWQLKQSLYSIGAGGIFGRGLGNSMQKLLYLPYRESDFIFAIIAEETGLVGCLILIILFALLIWRGVMISMNAPDRQGMILATGVTATMAIQVVINIMVNIGLCPPTGVVLPFISYGGSSVVIFMALMGLLLNVSKQTNLSVVRARNKIPFYLEIPSDDKSGRKYNIEKKKKKRR
ncbi:MAG: cell division protein FtsW [Clostridia bacterium]|nr:cell division protein FtsW [Clostridia bacterium]